MGRKLYVGDISASADESEIRQLFFTVGTVETINVVSNHRMRKPRGAFVEMATDARPLRQLLSSTRPRQTDVGSPFTKQVRRRFRTCPVF
jgi:hypothetical protein